MWDVSLTVVPETHIRFLGPGDGQVNLGKHNLLRNNRPHRDHTVLGQSFSDGRRRSTLGRVVFEPQCATPSSRAGLS